MKILSIILLFVFSYSISIAQSPPPPIKQKISGSSPNTITFTNGVLSADSSYIYAFGFLDTAQANVGWLKNQAGAQIRVNNDIYQRSTCLCQWIKQNVGTLPPSTYVGVSYRVVDSASHTICLVFTDSTRTCSQLASNVTIIGDSLLCFPSGDSSLCYSLNNNTIIVNGGIDSVTINGNTLCWYPHATPGNPVCIAITNGSSGGVQLALSSDSSFYYLLDQFGNQLSQVSTLLKRLIGGAGIYVSDTTIDGTEYTVIYNTGGGAQGLQGVITTDPVLTEANTIDNGGFVQTSSNGKNVFDSIGIRPSAAIGDSIVFYGTSITFGTGVQYISASYPSKTCFLSQTIPSNRGISSATLVVQGVAGIPGLPVYNSILYKNIVLEWGTNDMVAGDSTTFSNTYKSYIDTLITNRGWPATKIAVMGIGYINSTLNAAYSNAKQTTFRAAVQAVATLKGTLYVNIYNAELAHGTNQLFVDGLHPNTYGTSVMSNALVNVIRDTVISNSQSMAINGLSELQYAKLRTTNVAQNSTTVIGRDTLNNLVSFNLGDIVRTTNVLEPNTSQAGGIIVDSVIKSNYGAIYPFSQSTGSVPTNLSTAGLFTAYTANLGFLYANDYNTATSKNMILQHTGGKVGVSSAPSVSAELLQVDGGTSSNFLRVVNTLAGSVTGNAVEIFLNGTQGVIETYNRTSFTANNLAISALGGITTFGTVTPSGSTVVQIAGSEYISGSLGIGVNAPLANLHVVGTLRYVDGNQQAGYVLTSDADGDATWQVAGGGSSQWTDTTGGITYTGNTYVNGQGLFTDNVGVGIPVPLATLHVKGQAIIGTTSSGGTITSTGIGSLAIGNANNNGSIISSNGGSLAIGTATNGIIQATGDGTFAFGYAQDNDATIESTGNGSLAFGFANDRGKITANGAGGFAGGSSGHLDNLIETTADGSFTFGAILNNNADTVRTDALSSVTFGNDRVGSVYNNGNGSYVFGTGISNSKTDAFMFGVGREIFLVDQDTAFLGVDLNVYGTSSTTNTYTTSATPGIAAGAGAGTSPTVSIAGTNAGGVVTITTGTLPGTSGTVATITFSNSFGFPNGSSVILFPADANAAALSGAQMIFTNGSTGTWTMTSGTVALTGSTTFTFNYKVEGY